MVDTTNVPPPVWGSTGFVAPSGPAILAGVQQDINVAFGGNLNFALNTPQGQLASSWAAIISNNYATFQYYTQQFDPAYNSGRSQDAIARIYDLERDPAEPTVLQISCSGLSGVIIPVGAIVNDTANNLYVCTGAVTIPVGGSITTSFACSVPGPVAVPSTVSIYEAITGWDSGTVVSGIVGVNTETRSAFEARRQATLSANALGSIGAIIGAVAQVSGVTDFYGYDNSTAAPVTVGSVSVAARSIYICVAGGAALDVAQAILSKKAPGCGMTGTTTVTTYDSNPLYSAPIAYTIKFTVPIALQLLFAVQLVNSAQVPSDAATQVANALIAAVTQGTNGPRARIADVVYATSYIAAINALGSWAQVAAISIGGGNSPTVFVGGTISGTTLTVASLLGGGTIAVGQYVAISIAFATVNGTVITGTKITALGTGSGGVGTYTVNNSQTVGGVTFTGTGAGTNLTATSPSGTIVVGGLITGTGVPDGTVIVSQTSGTPGGAGVYVTSVATTSSGATITCAQAFTLATANHTSITVQADQEPQLVAGGITVTTT